MILAPKDRQLGDFGWVIIDNFARVAHFLHNGLQSMGEENAAQVVNVVKCDDADGLLHTNLGEALCCTTLQEDVDPPDPPREVEEPRRTRHPRLPAASNPDRSRCRATPRAARGGTPRDDVGITFFGARPILFVSRTGPRATLDGGVLEARFAEMSQAERRRGGSSQLEDLGIKGLEVHTSPLVSEADRLSWCGIPQGISHPSTEAHD